jgi:hypothetical protein
VSQNDIDRHVVVCDLNYILSRQNINIKTTDMKTRNSKVEIDNFSKYALSNEEMMNIRGGDSGQGDPIVKTTPPPIII